MAAALEAVPAPPEAEGDLVERARRGDADAYGRLVREHEQAAFRAAYLVVRSAPDAEDVTQEAFVKAFRALGRFRAGSPFRPWLLAIVGNEARNHLRAAGRRTYHQRRAGALEPIVAATPADDDLLRREDRRRVRAAVERLAAGERSAILARYFAGLTDAEAAAVLGIPRTTLRVRAWRGLQKLRRELGDESP